MIQLKDKEKERQFYKNGFVIIDIFNESEIERLRSLYYENETYYSIKKGYNFSTCDTNNKELIQFLDSEIKKIVYDRLNDLFDSFEYLLSSFLTKDTGFNNITEYHQDPTMIECLPNVSAGLWCPLQDTDENNGCLRVIKGSHRLGEILAVTPTFPTIFGLFSEKLDYFAEKIELKVGQGILFDNKLIHGAFPNHSNEKRIAVVSALKSKKCTWVYYYYDVKTNKVQKYLMNYDTYSGHDHFSKPKSKLIEEFSYNFEQKTYIDFLKFNLKNYPKDTVLNILKSLL